jgi:hypothetical protein
MLTGYTQYIQHPAVCVSVQICARKRMNGVTLRDDNALQNFDLFCGFKSSEIKTHTVNFCPTAGIVFPSPSPQILYIFYIYIYIYIYIISTRLNHRLTTRQKKRTLQQQCWPA